jgi:hypothetical protein
METPLKAHLGLLNDGRTRIDLFKSSTEFSPRTLDTELQFLPSNARSFEYSVSPINRYLKASVHLFLVYCEVKCAFTSNLTKTGHGSVQKTS